MRRRALIQKDLSWLKFYLTLTDEEKGRDLAAISPNWLQSFLERYYDSEDEVTSDGRTTAEIVDELEAEEFEVIDQLDPEIIKNFYEKYFYHFADDPQAPTYLFMSYVSTIRNQWLIHFTDEADRIQVDGFTKGVSDLSTLGLTVYLSDDIKSGGYNFAYLLDDFSRYGKSDRYNPHQPWKYGKEAVVFRASGIKVWHNGDDEPQVIFWGPSARDIVALTPGYCAQWDEEYEEQEEVKGWKVEPCNSLKYRRPFCAEKLEEAVGWLIDNFEQYRRVLTCR